MLLIFMKNFPSRNSTEQDRLDTNCTPVFGLQCQLEQREFGTEAPEHIQKIIQNERHMHMAFRTKDTGTLASEQSIFLGTRENVDNSTEKLLAVTEDSYRRLLVVQKHYIRDRSQRTSQPHKKLCRRCG